MKIIQAFWMRKLWTYKEVQEEGCLLEEIFVKVLPQEDARWLRVLLVNILKLNYPDYVLGMSFLWNDGPKRERIMIDASDPTFVLWKVNDVEEEIKIVGEFNFKDLEKNPNIEFFEKKLKQFLSQEKILV